MKGKTKTLSLRIRDSLLLLPGEELRLFLDRLLGFDVLGEEHDEELRLALGYRFEADFEDEDPKVFATDKEAFENGAIGGLYNTLPTSSELKEKLQALDCEQCYHLLLPLLEAISHPDIPIWESGTSDNYKFMKAFAEKIQAIANGNPEQISTKLKELTLG